MLCALKQQTFYTVPNTILLMKAFESIEKQEISLFEDIVKKGNLKHL